MAIEWGPWEGTSRQIRVGIEVDWSGPVQHGWDTVKATVGYWVDVTGSWSDSQTLHLSGAIDGTFTKVNYQSGADGPKRWLTREKTYTYGPNEYGSSPGKWTFSVTMSGAGGGTITPSKSVTKNIPSRPYGVPLAPNSVNVSRISDTSQKITWNNRSTAGEPWDRVRVQIDGAANGAWNGDVGTPGGGSSAFTDGSTSPNAAWNYRVRSENNVGDSAWVETGLILTTPATPTSVVRSQSGADQIVTWANEAGYTQYNTEVWRSVDGVWSLLATKGSGVTSHTDVAPSAANKIKYKVRHKTTAGAQGTLYSLYSDETTETPGITSAPAAPTNLAPANNLITNPTQARTFTWQYNSTDTTAQTQYEIQWRVAGITAWTAVPTVSSTTSSHTFAADTFPDNSTIEWQVRTRGANAAFGPWSATATFKTVGDPNAARANKRGLWLDLETMETITAPLGSFAPIGSMTEFAGVAAPPGWLLCQGQSVLREDYPDLFGVIGTRFGAVDSTHFNLPDMRDRAAVGASDGKALGAVGGSATSLITTTHLPKHTHAAGSLVTSTDGSHNHGVQRRLNVGTGTGNAQGGGSLSPDGNNISTTDGAHSHSVTGSTDDGGFANDPLSVQNPYVALNFIIKT